MLEKTKERMYNTEILGVRIQYNSGNIRIIDSYKVKDKFDMILILKLFIKKTGWISKRSVESWLKEWKAHNRLYKLGLFKSHTKDCDLEENEKLHRLIAYQILGI